MRLWKVHAALVTGKQEESMSLLYVMYGEVFLCNKLFPRTKKSKIFLTFVVFWDHDLIF